MKDFWRHAESTGCRLMVGREQIAVGAPAAQDDGPTWMGLFPDGKWRYCGPGPHTSYFIRSEWRVGWPKSRALAKGRWMRSECSVCGGHVECLVDNWVYDGRWRWHLERDETLIGRFEAEHACRAAA